MFRGGSVVSVVVTARLKVCSTVVVVVDVVVDV